MRLFIAEKPSLGRAIADGIGISSRGDGHIKCNDGSIVTWVFGHLLELIEAKEYDDKWAKWNFSSLPVLPDVMKKKVKSNPGAKKQYKIIKGLLAKATEVVNAGDPDREGQLLVDELLEDLNNKKPVKRILLAATDKSSVKKQLGNIKDNKDFQPLMFSAKARSEADWIYGINMTRAMTLTLQNQGGSGVLSIGRVQTPTLAITVQRELQIRNFVPRDYFICQAKLSKKPDEDFNVKFLPENNDNLGGDGEGYLIEKEIVDKVSKDIKEKAVVKSYISKNAKSNQPQCYNLSTLQKEGSSLLGFGAKKTLEVAQKLYEKGITSYPRSDSGFLPEEQFSDAKKILNVISQTLDIAKKADPTIKSPTWNSKKATVHHGIIPTEKAPTSDLSSDELALYSLIAKKYVAQFFPVEKYKSINLTVEDNCGQIWKATGKTLIDKGWKVIYNEKEEEPTLPELNDGDILNCSEVIVKDAKTKPPSRFTEGTLISAMASIQNYVENPKYKKILKETSGIGTDATRADVIEKLLSRNLLVKEKGKISPSEVSISMIQSLSPKMKDPGVTAVWEEYLKMIEDGELTYEEFIEEQRKFIPLFIEDIKEIKFSKDVIKTIPPPKKKPPAKAKK